METDIINNSSSTPQLPLIVVVGPTASGKTALAVELAEKYGGEIICADSRTVYRGMDIGTAKPSPEERSRVPHWGLDLVEPNQKYSAADFQRYATDAIADIRSRGRVPFLVGGTGLYVDSVVFEYQFGTSSDPDERQMLEKMTLEELYKYCEENNITLPENDKNKRYVIRAIEQKSINTKRRVDPIANSFIVGIATNKDILRTRIVQRAEQLFLNGVVEEAKTLGKKYGWDSEAMTSNIYPLIRRYSDNEMVLSEVKQKFITLDWRLAKRQITWLKRNRFIQWMPLDDAHRYLSELLEKRRVS